MGPEDQSGESWKFGIEESPKHVPLFLKWEQSWLSLEQVQSQILELSLFLLRL